MTKIEFFITRQVRGFRLLDGDDELHIDEVFESRGAAADAAIRFAQDVNALYSIYGC